MTTITVPPWAAEAVQAIAGLSKSQHERLVQLLSEPAEELDVLSLPERFRTSSEGFGDEVAKQAVYLVLFVESMTRRRRGGDIKSELARAFASLDFDDRRPDLETAAERAVALAGTPCAALASKAYDLYWSRDAASVEIMIVSGLTPVWAGINHVNQPSGYMVSHTLHIDYLIDGSPKSLNLDLDPSSVKALREACDEALSKNDQLVKLVKDSMNSTVINIGGGEVVS